MKSHYRVVVIGGGVVGASVLDYLAKLGWSDVALVEREHAAPGTELSVHIVGVERAARVIAPSPYDPDGRAIRV